MKQFWKNFFLRGLLASSGGPVILALIYGISGATGGVDQLSPHEVCLGILTITLLAFIVAGMTAIYQAEKLPLPLAILLHGGVLYATYIVIYLINGWLQRRFVPILIFTAAFIVGYAVTWGIIYWVTKAKTNKINKILKK